MNKEEIRSKIENDCIVFSYENDESIDADEIYSLGIAFCNSLKEKIVSDEKDISVAIGYDETELSLKMRDILLSAFDKSGATVYDCKKTFIPAMFRTVIFENANGGMFVSSCKNNEVKLRFVSRIGYIVGEQLYQIADFFEKKTFSPGMSREPRINNSLKIYAENIRASFCKAINSTDFSRPLRSLKFVVDSSNGIGDYFVNLVLLPLGAEVVEINDESVLQKECNNVCATVGLKFNYDFTGVRIFSREFGEITKEAFTFLLLNILEEDKDEVTVISNYPVTPKTKKLLDNENMKFLCEKESIYSLVLKQNEMNDRGVNCPVAISDGGVCSFHENHGMADPGYIVYKLILKIISLRDGGEDIDSLLEKIYNYSNEWKMPINSFDKEGYAKTVLSAFEGYSMKNLKWNTQIEENVIRNKTDIFEFEVVNCDNEYIKIVINANSFKTQYRVLEEIYTYFSKFCSLGFEELEGIF